MLKSIAMVFVASWTMVVMATASDDGLRGRIAEGDARDEVSTAQPPGRDDEFAGLETRHAYRRGRIPVILIHGLGRGARSWAPLIAALEADSRLSASFQFWTFTYDTIAPILYSAAILRRDLSRARRLFDPDGRDRAFDRMVLIGHSMGGLLAKLMAQRSGPAVWDLISARPFEQLAGPPEARRLLAEMAFFEPQPMVRRVIFIATPHLGSRLSAEWVRRIAGRMLHGPSPWCRAHAALIAGNAPGFFGAWFGGRCPDSIRDLAWGQSVLTALSRLPIDPSVKAHSIIALLPTLPGKQASTDGVVSYRGAHLEGVASERTVTGTHFCQDHPQVIEEVRRILIDHLPETLAAVPEVSHGRAPGADPIP